MSVLYETSDNIRGRKSYIIPTFSDLYAVNYIWFQFKTVDYYDGSFILVTNDFFRIFLISQSESHKFCWIGSKVPGFILKTKVSQLSCFINSGFLVPDLVSWKILNVIRKINNLRLLDFEFFSQIYYMFIYHVVK